MRVFRLLLRVAVLVTLAVAAVMLAAFSGEYPGETAAGRRVVVREVLPLALLAWVNLAALTADNSTPGRRRILLATAVVGDLALLVRTAPLATDGAAPLSLALPCVAILLLMGVLGVAWTRR